MMVIWRHVRVWSVLLLLSYIFGAWSVKVCKGQSGGVSWSKPLNLSNSPTDSMHPAIVADAYGNVHIFWSEAMAEITSAGLPETLDTIMYRRWDGQAWTESVDILAVSGDTLADFVAAAVDGENQLHLVWTGLEKFYYSTAPAVEAGSARAWSTPQAIAFDNARTAYESDVVVDTNGAVHIVYATRGRSAGVYHIMTLPDSGAWTVPVVVSGYLRQGEVAFMNVRLAIDASGCLHATWSTVNSNGFGQAVYYARSPDGDRMWEGQMMLADAAIDTGFTGFPSLLPFGSGELLLIHVDQGNRGRIERTSVDAGKTWSDPRFILPSMEGVNGFLIPLLDGGGGLHLVINMRPSMDQRVGIYYAPRAKLGWSPIVPVAVDTPYGPSAHYTDAVIRLGNEIHVVFTQLRGREIWYVRGTINGLDPVPAQAIPPTSVLLQMTDVPTVSITQPLIPGGTSVTLPEMWEVPSDQTTTQWTPIVAAVISAFLLAAGIVIWEIRKR